jgi:FtsZ-interacting cell division protein YlmF
VTTLGSWGPTLVLVVVLLVASLAGFRVSRQRNHNGHQNRIIVERGFDSLSIALESAERINAYDVSLLGDPQIHLSEVVRLVPLKYQDAAVEIPRHYLSGAVVSVDLSRLTSANAARLVDYCSGLLSGTSGWLFRATDRVIILTPVRMSSLFVKVGKSRERDSTVGRCR